MVRRSRLEVYFNILKVIEEGTNKPTPIMYKTNLSWATLQGIFTPLLDGGFIKKEKQRNSKKYYVTEKGRNALDYYIKSLDGLVKVEQAFSR